MCLQERVLSPQLRRLNRFVMAQQQPGGLPVTPRAAQASVSAAPAPPADDERAVAAWLELLPQRVVFAQLLEQPDREARRSSAPVEADAFKGAVLLVHVGPYRIHDAPATDGTAQLQRFRAFEALLTVALQTLREFGGRLVDLACAPLLARRD